MTVEVRRNPERSRYELYVDGELAGIASYRVENALEPGQKRIVFLHTAVHSEHKGRGLGHRLAEVAVEDARRNADFVGSLCPFIAGHLSVEGRGTAVEASHAA